jgi:hypothetical protein
MAVCEGLRIWVQLSAADAYARQAGGGVWTVLDRRVRRL